MSQLKVLYRQFLFRIVDFELLSADARGDASKLLGQFAALLIWFSAGFSVVALLAAGSKTPEKNTGNAAMGLVFAMLAQHFLIATTMLIVGLFAVLSWDATFPDRRDVMVVLPLPVSPRTMFLAKVAAVASSLGLAIGLFHSAMGIVCPLLFAKQGVESTLPALTFDATPAPVAISDIQAVMDRDLKHQTTTGALAPGTQLGIAIGVWKHGESRVFRYGGVRPDALFEIGSITKTFTGLILARMVAEGQVRLEQPVRELLPPGTVAKPGGEEIRLVDLSTHHSGLPEWPGNIFPTNSANPLADYAPTQLYEWLSSHGVAKPADPPFLYSSLGAGLLGQALAVRAGKSYEELLHEEITGPLGMSDTVISLPPEQKSRFAQGHNDKRAPVPGWDINALAGAGGIRSTAGDMLAYLAINLHPEKSAGFVDAVKLSHRVQATTGNSQIALGWFYDAKSGTYQHNGATGGYSSDAFFNPRTDTAAVVLFNSRPTMLLDPGILGEHIRQRLSGEPAMSLDSVTVPVSHGFAAVVRSFAAYWFTMIAAGVFVYGAILLVQGLAAFLLPRRTYLRASAWLQLTAIGIIMGVYFFQPGFGGLDDLTIGSIIGVIRWLPSYWFLSLYQQINGSLHPALAPLAQRAWVGLAFIVCVTPVVYTLSYWRTMRRIIEEPEISPHSRRTSWLPRFGTQPQTAIAQFGIRTLARSRQHRLILGFYLGIGLAFTSIMLKAPNPGSPNPWQETNILIRASSVMMMVLAALGTRMAFTLPLDLRANWIFRVVGIQGGPQSLAAARRAMLFLAVLPVWLVTTVVCMSAWPGWQNAGHSLVLGIFGLIVADVCLMRFRKIPFTCSWLPGKTHFHIAFMGALSLFRGGAEAVLWERKALRDPMSTAAMVLALALVWACVRLAVHAVAKGDEQDVRFEEEETPAIQCLGLSRDGAMTAAR